MSGSPGEIGITLRLFAQVRVAAGASTLERRVPAGSTAGSVARALLADVGLSGMAGQVVLAVNADFSDPEATLSEGDWLSIVPPVSGGSGAGPVVDVRVTPAPLEVGAALAAVADRAAGGTVLFQGTPRDVDALEFEAHEDLARAELARIGADLVSRHGLTGIALHHRLGLVPATEAAIVVVAASPRRGAAFDAARAALDEVKRRVPIWKAEVSGGERSLVEGQVVEGVRTLAAAADAGASAGPAEETGRTRLTHVAADGSARMVDVTDKAVTDRLARATATVRMSPATARLVADGSGPKGEVLATARLAGVLAAKRTAELVPLAHPLPLSKIDVQAQVDVDAGLVRLEGLAKTTGKTGVEIEALTAVLIAALTVYDMVKAVERHAVIEGVQVIQKAGGRHDFDLAAAPEPAPAEPEPIAPEHAPTRRRLTVGAVHVSTTRSKACAPIARARRWPTSRPHRLDGHPRRDGGRRPRRHRAGHSRGGRERGGGGADARRHGPHGGRRHARGDARCGRPRDRRDRRGAACGLARVHADGGAVACNGRRARPRPGGQPPRLAEGTRRAGTPAHGRFAACGRPDPARPEPAVNT